MNPSDKETRAIFLNFKEVRSLEKNCINLDSEKAYYISLINLDQKIVKVHYKRFKDKVAKIRSHLKPDELDEIKVLDETGNLPKRPMSSKLDSNLRIEAAERRLKLMPRAKSAVPRLMSRARTTDDTFITPRSPSVVRTNTRPLTSPAERSNTLLKRQYSTRSNVSKSATSRSPRKVTPVRTMSTEDENTNNYSPVPLSTRTERKNSIFVETMPDINNNLNQSSTANPQINNKLTIPRTNSIGSRSRSCSVESPSVDIKIEFANDNETDKVKTKCGTPEPNQNDKDRQSPTIQVQSDTSETPRRKSFSRTLNGKMQNGSTSDHTRSPSPSANGGNTTARSLTGKFHETKVDTLAVPSADAISVPTTTSPRPMSVPATKVTQFGQKQTNERPQTSTERALETRRKSVMNIRRASAMLAEGKTRTPFDCHEVSENATDVKPFRSIRDGALACTDIDKEILDSNIGDDLHKEIKKGMLLGEVATSIYLEDKIDNFLDRVDIYVKENPNYTYDPEKTKAELLEKAREAKKKKPKRNRLRRRQLERRLEEIDIEDMKKSRWLRHEDDELDISGVNTLVVDQMKMLNSLRFRDDSD